MRSANLTQHTPHLNQNTKSNSNQTVQLPSIQTSSKYLVNKVLLKYKVTHSERTTVLMFPELLCVATQCEVYCHASLPIQNMCTYKQAAGHPKSIKKNPEHHSKEIKPSKQCSVKLL